ncbi:MAG TPA: DivIVA domain-containing protein [Rhodothermales bacterium]|nr:DivIVA domain-containing protein [Rhodothermales bacterium]
MALTPLDIRKTEFTRRLRGFDPDEVVAYLELLAREYEGMLHEVQAREDRIRDLESRIQHYERIEIALEEALRTTRESQRQAVEAAHQKADQIRAEATREAEQLTRDAEHQRNRMRQEAQAIAVRRKEIVARLRAFLMSEMEVLAHFEGEDPVGYIKLMPQTDAGVLAEHPPEAALTEGRPGHRPTAAAPEPPPVVVLPTESVPGGSEPVVTPYGVDPVSHADYPTPAPETSQTGFDDAVPTETPEPTSPPPQAFSAEVDAYFQTVASSDAGPTLKTPPLEDTEPAPAWPGLAEPDWTAAPQGWAESGQGWAHEDHDLPTEAPTHAHEPGELPVPEPFLESVPDLVSFDPEPTGFHEPGASHETAKAPDEPHVAPAVSFEVREVRRERYRIESLLGPPLSAEPPVADTTQESDRIRRLLDSLD